MPNSFRSLASRWGFFGVVSAIAIVLLVGLPAHAAGSGYVTLEWDPSTDPEVVGYVVEYGESPRSYVSQLDAGNAIMFTVWNLDVGQTYYFSVRSYTVAGALSDYSNEESGQAQSPDGTVVQPPAAPSALTAAVDASNAQAQLINLAWTDNSNSEDWFIVERALDGVNFQYLAQTATAKVTAYADVSVLPQTTYSYRVIAQATNGGNSDPSNVASATTMAIPNDAPRADAGGPYSGDVGRSLRFDARGSSDPDRDSLTHAWDFGDGSTGTGTRPKHTYSSAGSYTATLFTTDGQGGSDSDTATVTVQAPSGGGSSGGGRSKGGRGRKR